MNHSRILTRRIESMPTTHVGAYTKKDAADFGAIGVMVVGIGAGVYLGLRGHFLTGGLVAMASPLAAGYVKTHYGNMPAAA